MIKTYILKKKLRQNIKGSAVASYPEKVEHLLVIYNEFNAQIEMFLNKLENYFKANTTIYKANLSKDLKPQECIRLNKKSIDWKGGFKDKAFDTFLPKTDLIIDLSEMNSLVKNYAISLAAEAYKISLNTDHNSVFQLTIKVDSEDLNQFFDEFIKYHNALQHGQAKIFRDWCSTYYSI